MVYAKTPLAGPAAVLDHLSRYTHRMAIRNDRLLAVSGDAVRFRTRINRQLGQDPGEPAARRSVTTLAGTEFVGRLMQHVVPSAFKRIRHYGLLAMPAASTAVTEEVRAFMQRAAGIGIERRAHCGNECWRVVACQEPRRGKLVAQSDDSAASTLATCRGPP